MDELFKKYIGKGYAHGGRGPERFDCWGLLLAVYRDLGIALWDLQGDYGPSEKWGHSHFIENYFRDWDPIDDPKPHDGVLFKNSFGIPVHAGVIVDEYHFIHAQRRTGVILSRLWSRDWLNRIEGFYRVRALA